MQCVALAFLEKAGVPVQAVEELFSVLSLATPVGAEDFTRISFEDLEQLVFAPGPRRARHSTWCTWARGAAGRSS